MLLNSQTAVEHRATCTQWMCQFAYSVWLVASNFVILSLILVISVVEALSGT